MDYLPLIGAVLAVITVLGGWIQALHNSRAKTADEDRGAMKSKLDKLDNDIDGLVKQMGADALDHERRYVAKEDHGREMREIKQGLAELGRKLEARFYRRGEHDPAC